MGQFLINLNDGKQDIFMMWSTIVDAPIVVFDDESVIEEWIRFKYGEQGVEQLPARMERLKAKGTSSLNDDSADEVIGFNRAGKDESCLTRQQIVDFYYYAKSIGEAPMGTFHRDDEE